MQAIAGELKHHAYPTQADAIRKAADACNRTRLTAFIQTLLRRWLQR